MMRAPDFARLREEGMAMKRLVLLIAFAALACNKEPQRDAAATTPAATNVLLPAQTRQSQPPKIVPMPKDQAELDRPAWSREFREAWAPSMYFFAGDTELYARMFAPALGIEEDPATGSAAVAIAGVLGTRRREGEGIFTWPIDQGVAMGRASRLEATAEKRGGKVVRVKVGGATLISAEGTMNVPADY